MEIICLWINKLFTYKHIAHICAYIHAYLSIYTHTHKRAHTHPHTRTRTHTHTHTHTPKHTHAYTHAHAYAETHELINCKETYKLINPSQCWYGVATISRLLEIISLFCRIWFLFKGSFAKVTYNFKPTNSSHPIPCNLFKRINRKET